MKGTTENNDDRFIWGAKAIGEEVGRTERQAYHLLESGLLPATRIGGQWVSTPRRLRQRLMGEDVK